MKISTVRSLLVLLDLALVGGIVGVVYLDMAVQQDERRAARRSYQQETLRRLAAVSVVAPKASTDQTSYSSNRRDLEQQHKYFLPALP